MVNAINKVHEAAKLAWENAGRKGIIAGATGIGKSKIALDRVKELSSTLPRAPRILLFTPTEKSRDVVWPNEAEKWSIDYTNVEGLCYVSASKVKHKYYDLLILDEGHHITTSVMQALQNITFNEILVLTATVPERKSESDFEKWELFDKLGVDVIFKYHVEQAIQDGVVSDFSIHIVELKLNSEDRYIKSGSKKKPFCNTEAKEYEYIEKQMIKTRIELNKKEGEVATLGLGGFTVPKILQDEVKKLKIKLNIIISKRARFIYSLPSKTKYAQSFIARMQKDSTSSRVLVFGGSIDQIEDLLKPYTYHSKRDDEALKQFQAEQIQFLGVVNAADESHNFPNIDYELIVQLSSVPRRLVQRIGRSIRFREGHKANIIILVVKGTVDERWADSALKEVDPSRIKRYKV